MCTLRSAAFAAGGLSVCLFLASSGRAAILISEVMYNPDSSEAAPNDVEWVEIFNPGQVVVDIGNWSLRDEDGTSADVIPTGTVIDPGQAIVLSSAGSTAAFQDAWGSGFSVFLLSFSALSGLNNSPSPTNEILELIDDSASAVDTVNFDDANGWPADSPDGASIYLLPAALSANGKVANDNPANWARAENGVDGAYQNTTTAAFNGTDLGSPGFVQNSPVPEPGSLLIVSIGLLCAATWRARRHLLLRYC